MSNKRGRGNGRGRGRGRGRGKGRGRGGGRGGGGRGGGGQYMQTQSNPIPATRPVRSQPTNWDGHVVSNSEYWGSVDCAEGVRYFRFCPGKSNLRILDGLGRIYDNYRVRRVTVRIQGTGPTTGNVNLAWAPDYRVTDQDTTREQILRRAPSTVQTAWQTALLSAGSDRLMRQRMYNTNVTEIRDDNTSFLIPHATSLSTGGINWEVWCSYTVEFLNPSGGA